MLIPMLLRNFGKQPGPTGVTPTMLLWLLSDQNSTHDFSNTKQMANKTNPYCKDRPGRSLLACIAIVNELSFLYLGLTFGTTPATAEYTTVSEAAIDLGNDILRE